MGIFKTAVFNSFGRIVFLSLIICSLLAFSAKGQNLPEQKINFNVSDMPLSEVLHIIEQKTSFTFSYINKELPLDDKVTLDVKDETLQQVLEILSKKFGLTFSNINNIITVKKKESADKNKLRTFGTLRGIIRDSATAEVLPYANVYIPNLNTGASSDSRGFFIIPSLPANKELTVIVSYVGYTPKIVNVYIHENKITEITIYLSKTTIELGNVTVLGKRVNEAGLTAEKIPIREIENMSFGVETDVMRSIQLLPGVQSAGDVSARYYVRGGASNENLVLLNDVPIYNPFHALGILSAIDPDIINGIEFYKGGFDAKYGGRLSSVLNIITKDGNKNNFGATAALSELTAKSVLEGPIPDGSFIITGRKSFSNEILKKFTNGKSVPIDFYDASFKVNYSNPVVLPISKFSIFGFISNDKIKNDNNLDASYNWSNSNIGFNWFNAAQDDPSFSEFTFYYSGFSGSEIPGSGNNRHIENKLDDYSVKYDYYHIYNDENEIYGGIKLYYIKTGLLLGNSIGQLKNIGSESAAFRAYWGYKLFSLKKLKVDFGSRFNIMNLLDMHSYFSEPRINLTYSLLSTLNLKAAWGIYQQELVTLSDEDEILPLFEPWIIIPDYLKVPNSVHYICGFDYYMTERIKLNVEGYYKTMHNLAVLNDQVIYPTDPQLINASGESHGAEATVNYNAGWLTAQFSYSYSWTTRKVRDIVYHPRYDSRNAIKIFINFELGNNWRAGISWNYNSGMPYTQIYGYNDKYNPLGISNPSSTLSNYLYFPILADRNAAHLPDYNRLDINMSKEFHLGFVKMYIGLNVINIYDRKNFFYFDMKTGERVNMLPFLPSIEVKAEL